MADTAAGLNFGPQWLRDTFQPETGGGGGGGQGGPGGQQQPLPPPGSSGGGYNNSFMNYQRGGGGGGMDYGFSNNSSYSNNSNSQHGLSAMGGSKLAAMKLAEFRYGREEMLVLADSPATYDQALPEEDVALLSQLKLWTDPPQPPINLQGPMSEEENRAWQRGANSDASIRVYKKEAGGEMYPVPGGPVGRGAPGIRGGSMGGPGDRGGMRGRGRGVAGGVGSFERHRSMNEDEEFGGGPSGAGRGRGELC